MQIRVCTGVCCGYVCVQKFWQVCLTIPRGVGAGARCSCLCCSAEHAVGFPSISLDFQGLSLQPAALP